MFKNVKFHELLLSIIRCRVCNNVESSRIVATFGVTHKARRKHPTDFIPTHENNPPSTFLSLSAVSLRIRIYERVFRSERLVTRTILNYIVISLLLPTTSNF